MIEDRLHGKKTNGRFGMRTASFADGNETHVVGHKGNLRI